MNSSISRVLTIASVLFLAALLALAMPSFCDPGFEVVNNAPGAVSVVAAWRSSEKEPGRIEPMSSSRFSINDEAAIMCKVKYTDGRVVESEKLYFTRGTRVIATITANGVEVRYDFET
jgi:hypothetical protein